MTTARTLIRQAMQTAGILTKTEQPSADEVSDGLALLNSMLDSWVNNTLTVYSRLLEDFPVSAGISQYTIGSGGDFNTTRPEQIVSAYFRDAAGTDHPIRIISDVAYDRVSPEKDTLGTATQLVYDRAVPLGTITLYFLPSESGRLFLRSEKAIAALSLDTDVTFPAGWELAIRYNLAVLLAPEYGQTVPDSVALEATRTKSGIMRAVARNRPMDTPPLVRSGGFNVYTGQYV